MPYLILILGLIVGAYALYRFFIKATPEQVRSLIRYSIIIVYVLILLFFALTGRIIISLALLLLSIPFVIAHFKDKAQKDNKQDEE
ncbi:MAG: hypothetical protein COB36_04140 [Alphaproteobacteria bacterium]|nr:MAG: hypothetical protein COB36_04140 [Alphaproteobacteria bacterium]